MTSEDRAHVRDLFDALLKAVEARQHMPPVVVLEATIMLAAAIVSRSIAEPGDQRATVKMVKQYFGEVLDSEIAN
jgi:hypothetical protein